MKRKTFWAYRNPLLIEQGRVFLEGLEGILARIKPSDPNLNLWLQLIYKTDIKLLSSSSVSNTYIGINWQANWVDTPCLVPSCLYTRGGKKRTAREGSDGPKYAPIPSPFARSTLFSRLVPSPFALDILFWWRHRIGIAREDLAVNDLTLPSWSWSRSILGPVLAAENQADPPPSHRAWVRGRHSCTEAFFTLNYMHLP